MNSLETRPHRLLEPRAEQWSLLYWDRGQPPETEPGGELAHQGSTHGPGLGLLVAGTSCEGTEGAQRGLSVPEMPSAPLSR